MFIIVLLLLIISFGSYIINYVVNFENSWSLSLNNDKLHMQLFCSLIFPFIVVFNFP